MNPAQHEPYSAGEPRSLPLRNKTRETDPQALFAESISARPGEPVPVEKFEAAAGGFLRQRDYRSGEEALSHALHGHIMQSDCENIERVFRSLFDLVLHHDCRQSPQELLRLTLRELRIKRSLLETALRREDPVEPVGVTRDLGATTPTPNSSAPAPLPGVSQDDAPADPDKEPVWIVVGPAHYQNSAASPVTSMNNIDLLRQQLCGIALRVAFELLRDQRPKEASELAEQIYTGARDLEKASYVRAVLTGAALDCLGKSYEAMAKQKPNLRLNYLDKARSNFLGALECLSETPGPFSNDAFSNHIEVIRSALPAAIERTTLTSEEHVLAAQAEDDAQPPATRALPPLGRSFGPGIRGH